MLQERTSNSSTFHRSISSHPTQERLCNPKWTMYLSWSSLSSNPNLHFDFVFEKFANQLDWINLLHNPNCPWNFILDNVGSSKFTETQENQIWVVRVHASKGSIQQIDR